MSEYGRISRIFQFRENMMRKKLCQICGWFLLACASCCLVGSILVMRLPAATKQNVQMHMHHAKNYLQPFALDYRVQSDSNLISFSNFLTHCDVRMPFAMDFGKDFFRTPQCRSSAFEVYVGKPATTFAKCDAQSAVHWS